MSKKSQELADLTTFAVRTHFLSFGAREDWRVSVVPTSMTGRCFYNAVGKVVGGTNACPVIRRTAESPFVSECWDALERTLGVESLRFAFEGTNDEHPVSSEIELRSFIKAAGTQAETHIVDSIVEPEYRIHFVILGLHRDRSSGLLWRVTSARRRQPLFEWWKKEEEPSEVRFAIMVHIPATELGGGDNGHFMPVRVGLGPVSRMVLTMEEMLHLPNALLQSWRATDDVLATILDFQSQSENEEGQQRGLVLENNSTTTTSTDDRNEANDDERERNASKRVCKAAQGLWESEASYLFSVEEARLNMERVRSSVEAERARVSAELDSLENRLRDAETQLDAAKALAVNAKRRREDFEETLTALAVDAGF